MMQGNEHFIIEGSETDLSISDFWKWAYSDFVNNIQRGALAEFIVASAIGCTEPSRIQFRPYDLLSPEGWRVEVKCAAYVQSWDIRHPDHVSYSIAPAQMPDPILGYVDNAPKQRNCDCYVFSLYKATSPDQNPLDMGLWEFFILKTAILNEAKPSQKTITLPSLLDLSPVKSSYSLLKQSLAEAMSRECL
jgi:hypothetical protein